jgi:hypothetical protein
VGLLCRSEAVSEVGLELRHQALLPIADRAEPAEEEAEDLRFFDPFEPADDAAVLVQPRDPSNTRTRPCWSQTFRTACMFASEIG